MNPVYSREDIKAWDAYTIANEPITSVDLMERAATACVEWIVAKGFFNKMFHIFCGKGNNGGDGLAIARMLTLKGYSVSLYITESIKPGSADFQTNLKRLQQTACPIHYIQPGEKFPEIRPTDIVIDALVGSGLNNHLDEVRVNLVQHINMSGSTVIAIDVPSGLCLDESSLGNSVIQATYTLTFQVYKLALLVAENASFFGEVHVLDIGLHPQYSIKYPSSKIITDETLIRSIYIKRNPFAHKGTYGHALIVSGSYGKMGAALLATTSCLRTGAGLVTAYIPKCGYAIMQTATPEAMTLTDDGENYLTSLPPTLENYKAIGIGPGLGTASETVEVLKNGIDIYNSPLVIDADGLNCLAKLPDLISQLPPNSILTPHPKEFERLFGSTANEFERIQLAADKAKELHIIIVLKGHHTLIALPNGKQYFNTTGNAGMAKGGSGDVLTGIITSLIAQNYAPEQAAILGVYLHGLAGDYAAKTLSMEAMIASDLVTHLSQAFKQLNSPPE